MKSTSNVLIVDDSPSLAQSLCKILAMHEIKADAVFNAQDALHKIRRNRYELMLCDIEMPGFTGLELLERIRQDEEHDLDVILMTGHLEPNYFIRAIQLGAVDFISKPIEAQQLVGMISCHLKRRHSRENLEQFMQHLDTANMELVIDPKKLSLTSISRVMRLFFKQNLHLPQDLFNELLICADEMVYNAYIHGTLGLSLEQRHCNHAEQEAIILQKLSLPEIAARRIRFSVFVDYHQNTISIGVSDDGEGFNYDDWLQRVAKEPTLSLDFYGRGIAMLYHLSDKLEFSQGGRKVQISRKLYPERAARI